MIFNGKSLASISDDDIKDLVINKIGEKQHLEYKVTVNYKDDKEKLELLRDITSFANGGGGYLIVGIREDGTGRALKFDKKYLKEPESIKKAIMNLSIEHISERIYGLEIETRSIDGNPIIISKIPDSDRKPHMVTIKNRTDFWTRYHDGKREMTIGEIKEAFLKDIVGRRLYEIESILKNLVTKDREEIIHNTLVKKIDSGENFSLLEIQDGQDLVEIQSRLFQKRINDKPFFCISIAPIELKGNSIDVDSKSIQDLIINPPNDRHGGWTTRNIYATIERTMDGIRLGDQNFKLLILLENGYMEFSTPLNKHFCWMQTDKEFERNPRLFPFPLIEYPVSFLRLYRAIIDHEGLLKDFILNFRYDNLFGYTLPPYRPGIIGFEIGTSLKPYSQKDLILPQLTLESNFSPDKKVFEAIKYFYAAFGYVKETIPFYNEDEEKFNFQQ